MTQEEKAKCYDEAYKVAEGIHRFSSNPAEIKRMEEIFPRLKDSDDERTRKEILEYFQQFENGELRGVDISDWIVWLERQGEHNMGISETTKQELENNLNKALGKETPESLNEFLEKKEEEIEIWLGCEAFPEGTNITPLPKAIEIVRETANHFYDFGRKQQATRNIQCTNSQVITPESYINEGQKKGIQIVLDNPQEYGLQKITKWSEEDEKTVESIITDIKYCKKAYNNCSFHENEIGWLKSLEDRVQPKQEWSEEDEKILKSIINDLSQNVVPDKEDIDWLKSLKDRVIPQPKQGWSDGDRIMLDALRYSAEQASDHDGLIDGKVSLYNVLNWIKSLHPQPKQEWGERDYKLLNDAISLAYECDDIELRDWLKILKERYTWFPSDEQMRALLSKLPVVKGGGDKVQDILESLYNDLKKLKN